MTLQTRTDYALATTSAAAACYLFGRAYNMPNRDFLAVIGAVDALINEFILRIGLSLAAHYSKQAGHQNQKYYHLAAGSSLVLIALSPIYYRGIGSLFHIETPSYIYILACLTLSQITSGVLIKFKQAYFPTL